MDLRVFFGHCETSRRFVDSCNIYVTTQWPAVSTHDLLTSAAPHLWMYARLNLFHARSDTCHGQRAYLNRAQYYCSTILTWMLHNIL